MITVSIPLVVQASLAWLTHYLLGWGGGLGTPVSSDDDGDERGEGVMTDDPGGGGSSWGYLTP